MSNVACNTEVNIGLTIAPMHPTMERLYKAAKELKQIEGQSALARAMDESPQTLNNWESRGVSKKGMLKAQLRLQISANWIETGEGLMFVLNLTKESDERNASREPQANYGIPDFLRRHLDDSANTEPGPEVRGLVPLISWVTAGAFDSANDPLPPGEAEDWLPMPKKNGKHTYALRVRGDSMTAPHGKSYPDGCIIFVDPEKRSPVTGDRIIAKLEGTDEVTFKQFVSDAGRVWLKPLNTQYPAIHDEFRVLGTIIGKWEDE